MFVQRTHGVVVALAGGLVGGACSTPSQATDLRPEGPPEVLAVLVLNDAATSLYEAATFCKIDDKFRPGQVGLPDGTVQQICDADLTVGADELTNAYPDGWYVRVMFDELLDNNVEDITEVIDDNGQPTGTYVGSIASTKPVTLQCQSASGSGLVNVDYDGYYSPSGNAGTWPVGPSIVIKPNDPTLIATNSECEVKLKDVIVDKDGNAVPDAQRGPFKFKVAPISIVAIDPSDDKDGSSPIDALQIYYDNPFVSFNTVVDLASLCPDADMTGLCDSATFKFTPDAGFCDDGAGGGTFATCKTFADCDGSMGDTLCGKGFCDTTGSACNKDADCTDPSDSHCESTYAYGYGGTSYELAGLATKRDYGIGPVSAVPAGTAGTVEFVAGAKLKDRCGVETTLKTPAVADNTLVHYLTNTFDLNSIKPGTGDVATMLKKPDIQFNNVIQYATLALNEWSISPEPVVPLTATVCTMDSQCAALRGGQCNTTAGKCVARYTTSQFDDGDIILRGHYAMNTEYTLTLKAGATVKDFYGDTYTNGTTDTVIKWKTQPTIALTSSTKDGSTVSKADPTAAVGVSLTFNQSMTAASLDSTKYTLVNSSGTSVVASMAVAVGATQSDSCGASSLGCTLYITGDIPVGDYTFTLLKDKQVDSVIAGEHYTQLADKVIKFTVKNATPVAPVTCL